MMLLGAAESEGKMREEETKEKQVYRKERRKAETLSAKKGKRKGNGKFDCARRGLIRQIEMIGSFNRG
jgi:hypothetical protein